MLNMDIEVKQKNIFAMPELRIVIVLLILSSFVFILNLNCLKVVIVVVTTIIAVEMIIRMQRYNRLVKEGTLYVGRVKEIYALYANQVMIYIKAEYFDENTGNTYYYKDMLCLPEGYGSEVRQYLRNEPEIYIMVDRYMPQKGIVLVQEIYRIKKDALLKIRNQRIEGRRFM